MLLIQDIDKTIKSTLEARLDFVGLCLAPGGQL